MEEKEDVMVATQLLRHLLDPSRPAPDLMEMEIEAPPKWFPKPTEEDPNAIETGEAQATVNVEGRRYCISVEALP